VLSAPAIVHPAKHIRVPAGRSPMGPWRPRAAHRGTGCDLSAAYYLPRHLSSSPGPGPNLWLSDRLDTTTRQPANCRKANGAGFLSCSATHQARPGLLGIPRAFNPCDGRNASGIRNQKSLVGDLGPGRLKIQGRRVPIFIPPLLLVTPKGDAGACLIPRSNAGRPLTGAALPWPNCCDRGRGPNSAGPRLNLT